MRESRAGDLAKLSPPIASHNRCSGMLMSIFNVISNVIFNVVELTLSLVACVCVLASSACAGVCVSVCVCECVYVCVCVSAHMFLWGEQKLREGINRDVAWKQVAKTQFIATTETRTN